MVKEILTEFSEKAIPYWGAILSTVLAIEKFWSIWKNRPRIEVFRKFSTDAESGNEITIMNISSTPMIIAHWELFHTKAKCDGKYEVITNAFEMGMDEINIPAYSSRKLVFADQDYFSWYSSSDKPFKIYLRLFIAGKSSSVVKQVFSSQK